MSENIRVAIDLDGVIFQYKEWEDVDDFGAPILGARTFLNDLREMGCYIIIHTSRINKRFTGPCFSSHKIMDLLCIVRRELVKHDLPFDMFWTAKGKPLADFYIDDRAIRCNPEDDISQYSQAIGIIERKSNE